MNKHDHLINKSKIILDVKKKILLIVTRKSKKLGVLFYLIFRHESFK